MYIIFSAIQHIHMPSKHILGSIIAIFLLVVCVSIQFQTSHAVTYAAVLGEITPVSKYVPVLVVEMGADLLNGHKRSYDIDVSNQVTISSQPHGVGYAQSSLANTSIPVYEHSLQHAQWKNNHLSWHDVTYQPVDNATSRARTTVLFAPVDKFAPNATQVQISANVTVYSNNNTESLLQLPNADSDFVKSLAQSMDIKLTKIDKKSKNFQFILHNVTALPQPAFNSLSFSAIGFETWTGFHRLSNDTTSALTCQLNHNITVNASLDSATSLTLTLPNSQLPSDSNNDLVIDCAGQVALGSVDNSTAFSESLFIAALYSDRTGNYVTSVMVEKPSPWKSFLVLCLLGLVVLIILMIVAVCIKSFCCGRKNNNRNDLYQPLNH